MISLWFAGLVLQNRRLYYANPDCNSIYLELRASAQEWSSPIKKSLLKVNASGAWGRCSRMGVKPSAPEWPSPVSKSFLFLELRATAQEWLSPVNEFLSILNVSGAQGLCSGTGVSSKQILSASNKQFVVEMQCFCSSGPKFQNGRQQ